MPLENDTKPAYQFSEKYDDEHAREYLHKHQTGLKRRLSNWRERGMVSKALKIAGNPKSVLDLPCGTGRFWELLAENPERTIYAADNSASMFETGLKLRSPEVTRRIAKTYQCSAFDTGLPDNLVECVFSIRLLHHIQRSEDRVRILTEYARISSSTVIVSLWVDGNFKAWRLKRRLAQRAAKSGRAMARDRSLVTPEQLEQEFKLAGLEVVGHADFLPHWDKWRAYVLRVKK